MIVSDLPSDLELHSPLDARRLRIGYKHENLEAVEGNILTAVEVGPPFLPKRPRVKSTTFVSANFAISPYYGSPSQGSEHPGMFRSHFAPPDFRVLSGINRFLINENRF